MSERNDAELVRICLEGNAGAFAELIDRHQKVVYNTALKIAGNPQDAEDITQTVFLKVYENLDKYDSNHKFFSWVYRMVINEALNLVKRRRPSQELNETLVLSSQTPESQFEERQIGECIDRALMKLKMSSRLVVVLRHFLGMSHEEMGEVLGVPAKTVKSRLFTARRQLCLALRKQGVDR
jgi:RNA polymerase sigma-70 factor (ECF subfamily)